jgi:hypothetical protein
MSVSVFTSFVTQQLDVPHDEPNTITIRKLAPGAMREAQQANQERSMDDLKRMGGAAFLRELGVLGGDTTVQKAVERDPMMVFDRQTVLRKGVLAWSYDRPVGPDAGPEGLEALDDLDERTAAWLAEQVIRLSDPDRFTTEADKEQDQKND